MSRIDLDGWTPRPFDLEREIARSLEHLHRSIGQRARWALVAIKANSARAAMDDVPPGTIRFRRKSA